MRAGVCKPFVDLKGIGERSRVLLEGLLQHWKSKNGFEAYTKTEGLGEALDAAVEAIPDVIEPDRRGNAIANLEQTLLELGMRPAEARQHAIAIADIVSNMPR